MRDLFWNMHQDARIQSAEMAAHQSESRTRSVKDDIIGLEERLDRLLLVTQALWSLLRKRTKLTEDDLMNEVTELDLQDGKLDGKVTKPIVRCPKCDSAICHKFNRCLFCGEPYKGGSAFSTV
jgi:hypothetical protein